MISYEPLWQTMREQNITTYTLITSHNISSRTIFNLKHNKSITMNTLEHLCNILNCTPNDIIRFYEWFVFMILWYRFSYDILPLLSHPIWQQKGGVSFWNIFSHFWFLSQQELFLTISANGLTEMVTTNSLKRESQRMPPLGFSFVYHFGYFLIFCLKTIYHIL